MTKFEEWLETFPTRTEAARSLGWSTQRLLRVLNGQQPANLKDAEKISGLSNDRITWRDLLAHYDAKQHSNNKTVTGESEAA